jgi:DNA-binding MarR family transcriptional regulator
MATETPKKTKAQLIEELGDVFRRAQNRTQVVDELAAERLGINLTDLRCLDIVQRLGGVTAGRLATESGLTTGAVTSVVDRLERAGYARRIHDETDRRRVRIELTPKAERAAAEIYGPVHEHWVALLDSYTADELRLVLDMMNRGEKIGWHHVEALRSE